VEESAQDIADGKSNVKSSHNNGVVPMNKRATMSHQEEKTSDVDHSDIIGEQKSHISAVQEGEAKK